MRGLDPLAINLGRQTRALLSAIPSTSSYATEIINASSTSQLLAVLSKLLAVPAFTLTIAALFRPTLFILCASWLHAPACTEEQFVALCLLLDPHEELFPILYRLLTTPDFQMGPLAFIAAASSPLPLDINRLHRLLLAYYRILRANRQLPHDLSWPLSPLLTIIRSSHFDNGARLMAIRAYALQSGMGEAEREKMERQVLGEPCAVDCQMEFGQNIDGIIREVDGWIMPVIEIQRIKNTREEFLTNPYDYFTVDEGEPSPSIQPLDLSPLVANVHGVFLLRTPSPSSIPTPTLISTSTAIHALQNLAFHLSLRLPTLLTSPPSSGKSLFLSHLAELLYPGTKNQIITIHLADTSLDPRALLGSYVSSTSQPGTFEWKEGVLIRSMRQGKWVVLEDIDKASNEVLGVIKPLVESLAPGKWIGGRASLQVPSRGCIIAHDGFALFATRSILPSRGESFPAPVFFGAHKFHEITVPAPSPEELHVILDSQFPHLSGSATSALTRLWHAVKALGPAASARHIGLRELEKFCTRIQRLLPPSHQSMDIDSDGLNVSLSLPTIFPNPTLREEMYLEARDVFFGSGTLTASARVHSDAIANVIAEHLGLDADRRLWVLHGRTPDFDLEKDVNGSTLAVRLGRVHLPARKSKLEIAPPMMRPFAMHKPAILLLSRIATAVSLCEPLLLTGETGTGKTSVVTHLASLLRRPLISLNLSHQTESSDLLGGFKPVDARIPGSALQQRFLDLFGGTFSRRKNERFEVEVRKAVGEGKWKRAVALWKESSRLARERILAKGYTNREGVETPRKRRKVDETGPSVSEASWATFVRDMEEFEVQHVQGKGKFAFGFVEGPLVKALRTGDWVLLDEINLASPETLECISGLLHGPTASITLTEQGSLEPVPRHPDFRLFACMNPATDVGKKDLPPNIRSRFTEIDVPPPDADKDTLLSIVAQYIGANAVGDKGAIMNVAEFYSAVKDLAEKRKIADGANHRPHYSIRTLARALTFASDVTTMFGLRRAIWEGCLMAFTMVLDSESTELVMALAQKYLLAGVRNPRSLLTREPQVPPSRSADEFIKFGPFYLERGPLPEDPVEDYIMTPSVETKLIDLARIILTRRFPILIEGPTSSGKTSSVEYLAKRTGHQFIRINNHEHTDIQEYIGSYVSDPQTGKLVFKDGLLVRALRNGDWIVLDELNLAPTDVLEALNRLLDDNRELVIPETQEVVKPHPHFMLFATQNPPGLYAGRKILSRAFRNRFLEVHFEDVPQVELETILWQRCRIAPSYGKKIVTVFHELQKRRQSTRVFESKQGFATLRDLFRWAGRDAVGYQELAENGYMLLAERARREDDKLAVKEIIESVMNVKIDESKMYDTQDLGVDVASYLGCSLPTSSGVIWTSAMQRLFTLVARALRFNEPVLLVGETGSGKTSVCQVYADATSQRLHGVNCHQNTETADLIGGLRPVRNRASREAEVVREATKILQELSVSQVPHSGEEMSSMVNDLLKTSSEEQTQRLQYVQHKLLQLQSIFEWHDGPLVDAMRNGDVFLLDEISLADDSVLERLNSVLEPGRSIVLAEKGGEEELVNPAIRAADDFKLVATMNPGGDYGKKELSPALRNRFTEIWVPRVDDRRDLELIVGSSWRHEELKGYTICVLDFTEWLCERVGDRSLMSLRDILAWVAFTNAAYNPGSPEYIPADELFHHAAHMTFLDGLGSLPQLLSYTKDSLQQLRDDGLSKLMDIVPLADRDSLLAFVPVHDPLKSVQFGSFAIGRGPKELVNHTFNMQAPTTRDNAMRVVRACQVSKPILLEGSPGVGKTSLVTAIANISGHELCRINLSDQTDLIDLFGSDLPVEGGGPGEFAWKDAEFLKALQEGHWVLLDEMNLAPQAVLEGLNAILDHRGTVFIPELGKSFTRHPSFRIFAAQNPLSQGGGRKGLPKSFVNRFTKVYVEELSPSDLFMVCQHIFPEIDETIVKAMISYNMHLHEAVAVQRRFAREGSPWEFNLRDVIRWGSLLQAPKELLHPIEHLRTIYLHRFRTVQDRNQARELFDKVFSLSTKSLDPSPNITISSSHIQVGHFLKERNNMVLPWPAGRILKMQLPVLESLGHCVSQGWLAILTGQRNSGKTYAVRVLAHFTGNILQEISINSATDTMDILGSFEQVDMHGHALALVDDVLALLDNELRLSSGFKITQDLAHSLRRARTASTSLQTLLQMALETLARLSHSSPLASALSGKINAQISTPNAVGRFEWVDGPLVRAIKLGHWLLLDGANLCNPSVLDRLNSLCEQDGFLTLSERGYVDGEVQILKPHPNFRLFMTVDPQYGELSRAMRNRGIEISLIIRPIADDRSILSDFYRLPSALSDSWSASVLFEAIRRGIVQEIIPTSSDARSMGQALDQESALSSLVDRASMMMTSSRSLNVKDAHLFFLSRALEPASIPYLTRFLAELSPGIGSGWSRLRTFLNSFSNQSLNIALMHFRETYCLRLSLPADLVLTQPLDFYLNAPPCADRTINSSPSSAHYIVLQALDLATAIFLDEEDQIQIRAEVGEQVEKINKKQKTTNEISALLGATHSLACSILNVSTTENLISTSEEMKLASTLLGYGRYLRRVAVAPSLDFSAVTAICRWIHDAVENHPPSFAALIPQMQALRDTISLSSGLGLIEIWSAFLLDTPLATSLASLQDLDEYSSRLHGRNAPRLRREAFNFMAIRTLPIALHDYRDSTSQLESNLQNLLKHHVHGHKGSEVQPALLVAELNAFGHSRESQALAGQLGKVIELVLSSTGPLLRAAPYQHLLWAVQEGRDIGAILVQAKIRWLGSLWNTSSSNDVIHGPSMLLRPTQLMATISACDWTKHTLISSEECELALYQHANSVRLLCEYPGSHVDKLAGFLYETMSLVASCFVDCRPYNALCDPKHFPDTTTSMLGLIAHLELSDNVHFRRAVEIFLRPPCQHLQASKTRGYKIASLGLLSVAVGNMIMDLFIPDTPIDPAAIQNCTAERWQLDQESLTLLLNLHRKLEELTTGNSHNEISDYLRGIVDDLARNLSTARKLPVRKDLSRLRRFWSEVSQFREQILAPSKIQELLARVELGDQNAILRESVLQQSMAGFCQRLDTVYIDFVDLKSPLHLGILHIRLGLRLVTYSVVSGSTADAHTSTIASALVAFPCVRSSDALCADTAVQPPGIPPFSRILLTLSAIAVERSVGVSRSTEMDNLDLAYQQATRLWLIDRAKEKEVDAAAQSLYRRKNLDHDALGEAEMEEREFLELFPTFEDVLDLEARTQIASQKASEVPVHVSAAEMRCLSAIHNSLFSSSQTKRDPSPVIDRFREIRTSTLLSLLSSQSNSLPDTLDIESIPAQFSLLQDMQSELRTAPGTGGKSYNFYTDANVLAAKKAVAVVSTLKNRLETLINQWPDQMVLQHLKDRCELLLGLDLHSPVPKILSALEQLLMQTEDWEIYSNRENSLKSNQQELIRLIVEWRRMELSCWQVLLESQATDFAEGVSEWWFRLYDATVRGPLDTHDAEAGGSVEGVAQYLDTLIPLLDDFIRSSPLGQFRARVSLLQTFEGYLDQLSIHRSSHQRITLDRIRRVLHVTGLSYNLYSLQISAHLAEQRAVLEKEIRGFIKLASWKDINVQALKASAQRTHHQLYKIIRKFRNVLREPILERLRPKVADTLEMEHLLLEPIVVEPTILHSPFPEREAGETSSSHLANLQRTFTRFTSLVDTRIRAFIHSASAHTVDDLAVNIITTAKELAATSVPKAPSAEKRLKQQKALLVRKRKAWSDLLKELKRAGLSASVKPEILRQNADTRWLREQPIVTHVAEIASSMEKSENYWIRLCGLLPELRSTLRNHHSDLTTRELQRGLGFLESAFSTSVDLRSRLAFASEKYRRLSKMWSRLRMISCHPDSISSGPSVLTHVVGITNIICKLSSALQDIREGGDSYNVLTPSVRIPDSFFHDLRSVSIVTTTLQDKLTTVAENVTLTSTPVLLDNEAQVVREVVDHFSKTSADLRRWSEIHPHLSYLLHSVDEWLTTQEVMPLIPSDPIVPLDSTSRTTSSLINSFLVMVQNLISRCPDATLAPEREDNDGYITQGCHAVRDFTHLLNIDATITVLEDVFLCLATDVHNVQNNLRRILPFLDVYMGLVKDQLRTHSHWTSALFKLIFVLCSIILNLSKEGFCQPPDTDEQGVGEDESQASGGVGLGEGSGTENVSKEIEEESQVEGLQGEDVEGQGPRDDKGDGDAVEMSEEFGGEMEDVPDAGSEDENKSDHASDLDPEERREDLDPTDPSAVDEKLWGDEKGAEDRKEPEKLDQDHSEEQEGESEVVAKEGKSKSRQKDKSAKENGEEKPQDLEEEPGAEHLDADEERPNANGAPMDDYLQDADTLDLPDDMDLGRDDMNLGEKGISDGAEGDGDDDHASDKMDDAEPDQGPDDTQTENWGQEDQHQIQDDIPQATDQEQDQEAPPQASKTNEDEGMNDENTDEKEGEEVIARPDISAGDGTTPTDETQQPDGGENTATDQRGSTGNATSQDADRSNEVTEQDSLREVGQPSQPDTQITDSQLAGEAATGVQEGQAPLQPDGQLLANPLRSLGDALKEIRQRFDDILSSERREALRESCGDADTPSQLEYLQPDDIDHEMQGLGPAGEEQVAKLNDLKLIDKDDPVDGTAPMDVDMPLDVENHVHPSRDKPPFLDEVASVEQGDGIEGAISQSAHPITDHSTLSTEITAHKADEEMEYNTEHAVEVQLREWQVDGFPDAGAEKIWRLYESITHDLAYALCEQLRLILEPTLATRLKGDYRTGKRLNMKKIISYIASDYTKDKIWLRRTRPSQREYQVLITIDDSRSMAESHSIHLAYQTLALVSKALSRLEAGDIAIAKFGETVDMLHGFDEGPFTDWAGTKVVNAFRFNQKATNVLALVETSLKVLENARERRSMSSATAAELWQLEFIISDGMCQDHERLRTVLRKAEEQKVMIVFVILDSLHTITGSVFGSAGVHRGPTQGSILTMDKAEFKNVDGRMELQLQKYLDSFPFEYYVVLRSVEALPEVLAGTLKQFFERISEE